MAEQESLDEVAAGLAEMARELLAQQSVRETLDRIRRARGQARREQSVYRIADVSAGEGRWPDYVPHARRLGIGSMVGFLLCTAEDTLGALDLYSSAPNTFTEDSEQIGWLLASHAAVAFAGARHDAQSHEATGTRR